MSTHVSHWIGGKPWTGEASRRGDVYDPATGQVTGQVDFADEAVVIQMHADRERVVANFVEGFPRFHRVFEQQIVRFLSDQVRHFM